MTILVTCIAPRAGHDDRRQRRISWRLIAGFLTAVCALLPLFAMAGPPSPVELVKDTTSRLLTAVREQKSDIDRDEGRLYTLISDIALPHFDFNRMSMWTLGHYWRSATPEQRTRFVAQFRQLLVRSYSHTLMEYRDTKIRYLPLLAAPDAQRVTVRCEAEPAGGNPVQFAYAMYLTADGWKVYDVLVEGVSLVTNYRSSFAAIIREQGMDGLIRQLAEKNGEPDHG
ncbi:MAG: ABC transporter substrate-binding protein [Gammaproteobacteria bacterium]